MYDLSGKIVEQNGIIEVMLETIVVCAGITIAARAANRFKQWRLARRELISTAREMEDRFGDLKDKQVMNLTMCLSEEEFEKVGDSLDEFLSDKSIISKEQATAILWKKGEEKRDKNTEQTT